MLSKLCHWLFSPEVGLWIIPLTVTLGVALALAPTNRNVRLAHPFFLAATIWSLGCTFEWLANAGQFPMKYVLAFLIGGAIFTLAVASFGWVESNHAEQLGVSQSHKSEEPKGAANTQSPGNVSPNPEAAPSVKRSKPKKPGVKQNTQATTTVPATPSQGAPKEEPKPPVLLNLVGTNMGVVDSYVVGGSINTESANGAPSSGTVVEHTIIDARPWFTHLEKMKEIEASDATKPRFVGKVSKFYRVQYSPLAAIDLYMYAELENKGQPSAIKNWRLDYENGSSKGTVDGRPLLEDMTVTDDGRKTSATMSIMDSTTEITSGKELSKDKSAKGWIKVHIPHELTSIFQKSKMPKIKLLCQDDGGNDHVIGESDDTTYPRKTIN
jgi:hypothetical protein